MAEVRLKDICEFRNGKAHENFVDENGKYTLVTSKFISSDTMEFRKTNFQLTPLYEGELCMVMSDVPNGRALAKCFLVDENNKYTLNQRIGAFTVDERFNKKYFYYLMNRNRYFLSFNDGNGQTNLRKDDILNFRFKYIELSRQKEIVQKLDQVKDIIAKRKKQLMLMDDLIKSRFIELFGDIHEPSKWEKKPWSELVTIQNGRDYKNILVESGGYPVYGTGGEMARASEYLCPENTIIVGRKGTINNPLLVKEKFWNVDTAFGVIVGNRLHYQYFYNFCRMFDFSTLNKQAVLPSTTKADLLKIEIAVPPMELQKQFAAFVEQTDKSKFVENITIFLIVYLFETLIGYYNN